MPRTKKKTAGRQAKDRTHEYIDDGSHDEIDDEDLPSDEAGRRKIKRNYEELLGIRIEKLKGTSSQPRKDKQKHRRALLHLL